MISGKNASMGCNDVKKSHLPPEKQRDTAVNLAPPIEPHGAKVTAPAALHQ
jgi:hypothetical protein